jgi:hypothetical protein
MTGYTQPTITSPRPHGCPFPRCTGYAHQYGRRTSLMHAVEHAGESAPLCARRRPPARIGVQLAS